MASLLTVTGSRLTLAPNRTYVIGRAPECDFPIEDFLCSRNHARITVGAGSRTVMVEDIDSRNGTYVNGERISGRTLLTDGNRIQIGGTVFLLSLLDVEDAGDDGLLQTGTVAYEKGESPLRGVVRPAPQVKPQFTGQLASFPVVDLIQFLMRMRRTGTLHLETAEGRGEIDFQDGQIYSASCGHLSHFDALLHLVQQDTGFFWLVERTDPVPCKIKQSTSQLLLELCRVLDERKAV